MPSWGSFSYAFGPLMAVGLIAVFVFVLRWAFGGRTSVVAAPPKQGAADEYGILVPIASPGSYAEGEMIRRSLEDAGIRANLATTLEGPRVMVWPADEQQARAHVAKRR
jgi:hypothetical protein